MKKMTLGLMLCMIVLPALSFSQMIPQPPDSWIAFEKQEKDKKAAFFKEIKADRDAFLNANPDVREYLEQKRAADQARHAALMAARQHKTPAHSMFATPSTDQ